MPNATKVRAELRWRRSQSPPPSRATANSARPRPADHHLVLLKSIAVVDITPSHGMLPLASPHHPRLLGGEGADTCRKARRRSDLGAGFAANGYGEHSPGSLSSSRAAPWPPS
jgi:hypothetical protein